VISTLETTVHNNNVHLSCAHQRTERFIGFNYMQFMGLISVRWLAAIDTNGLSQIPSKQNKKLKKKEEKKEEFLALARFLLPTSNLLLPSTVYIWTDRQTDRQTDH